MCVFVQAKIYCTTSRAKKVTAGLTAVAVVVTAGDYFCRYMATDCDIRNISRVAFNATPALAILVINVVVVVQMRRAASNAAANLGVHPHQSTGNNSAVPTIMLVVTSLTYVFTYGIYNILHGVNWAAGPSLYEHHHETYVLLKKIRIVIGTVANFVYAYNFYVYLITGKRFRSELLDLFRRCLKFKSSSSSAPAPAAAAPIAVVDAGKPNGV